MYKRLRRIAQNFIEIELQYSTESRNPKFFCDILSHFISKWNALKHYDAKNTPNLTIINYLKLFFSAFVI